MKIESLLQYLEGYLGLPGHPDYPQALNGLQVEGPGEIRRVVAAVDASEATITEAIRLEADLLLVHHGLFWGGLEPVTGRRYRKLKALLDAGVAVFSVHLPLDGHAEVGNSALLANALGLTELQPFAAYKGVDIGYHGVLSTPVDPLGLQERVADVVGGGAVHLIPGGPARIETVGVVTGGGASFVSEAVALGLHALVTGEGSHHTHFDAMEEGIHVCLAGHYATETFGVRALAAHLAERFDLEWDFVDLPTHL